MKNLCALAITLLSCLLMLSCTDRKSRQMEQIIIEADSMNRNYVPMTSDSLLTISCDFYDRHGTPNERMKAHYLLGCAYRDMGEAPVAIAAYQEAIGCADTFGIDCDHALLARIYAQIADVFYMQNLMDDNLESLNASIHHANLAHDTLMALNIYAYKMAAYERIGLPDSVTAICRQLYDNVYLKGGKQTASQYFGLAIDSYLQKGDVEMADTLLKAYEQYSGYFDSIHDIEEGRESYYELKGRYFIAVNKFDSAEFYFRKELAKGKDFINQNMAARGLALLYQRLSKSDSAAKYSLYSYEMNDSVYAQMATEEVEQVKGMYDYGRHQRMAIKERKEAEAANKTTRTLAYIIIGIVMTSAYILERLIRKENTALKKYRENLARLKQTEMELQELRLHGDMELAKLVESKENEVKELREEVARFRKGKWFQDTDEKKELLESTPTFQNLHAKADIGKSLTNEEWEAIEQLIIEILPEFHSFISAKKYSLSIHEYHTCLLLRLYVSPKPASNLMGLSPSTITKSCKSILNKVFNTDGSAKELKEKLLMIK